MKLKGFDSVNVNTANLRQWFPENHQFVEFIGRKLRKTSPTTKDLGKRLERISRLIQADPENAELAKAKAILSTLKALVISNLLENYWSFCPSQDPIASLEKENFCFESINCISRSAGKIMGMGVEKFGFLTMLEKHADVMQRYLTLNDGKKLAKKELKANGLQVWEEINRLFPCEDENNYNQFHQYLSCSTVMEEMKEEKRLYFLKTPCGKAWIRNNIDNLLMGHNEFLMLHFPINQEETAPLYVNMSRLNLSHFEASDLFLLFRSEVGRKRFEDDLRSHVELYNQAYPASDLTNFHLHFKPEVLLTLSLEDRQAYLKTPSGRKLAEQKTDAFFADEQLKAMLFEAYPPENKDNLPIYVKIKHEGDWFSIKLLPNLVKMFPDHFLGEFFDIRDIHVSYFDSPAIDAGALRRQFVSDFIEGLLTNSTELSFTKSPLGIYPKLRNPLKFTFNEELGFMRLGNVFAFAIKSGIPLGERFHPKWLACFLNMIHEDDSNSHNHSWSNYKKALTKKSDLTLLQWFQEHVPTEEPFAQTMFALIEKVFVAESFENAIQAASALNLGWECDQLETALANQSLAEAKVAVRKNLLEAYEGYLHLTYSSSDMFVDILPLTIDGVEISSTDDLGFISSQQFAFALQGRLDADWLKERIIVEGEDPLAVENVQTWVQEWLESHREEPSSLKNLLIYLTGSAGLHGMITFTLYNQADAVVVHACFSQAHVKMTITKEELYRELDLYASGVLTGFTIA